MRNGHISGVWQNDVLFVLFSFVALKGEIQLASLKDAREIHGEIPCAVPCPLSTVPAISLFTFQQARSLFPADKACAAG